jgi:hypothetical protein
MYDGDKVLIVYPEISAPSHQGLIGLMPTPAEHKPQQFGRT